MMTSASSNDLRNGNTHCSYKQIAFLSCQRVIARFSITTSPYVAHVKAHKFRSFRDCFLFSHIYLVRWENPVCYRELKTPPMQGGMIEVAPFKLTMLHHFKFSTYVRHFTAQEMDNVSLSWLSSFKLPTFLCIC